MRSRSVACDIREQCSPHLPVSQGTRTGEHGRVFTAGPKPANPYPLQLGLRKSTTDTFFGTIEKPEMDVPLCGAALHPSPVIGQGLSPRFGNPFTYSPRDSIFLS